ncbi:Dam family site-specific DNA-(adenine-N6)-methyltransferase [Bombella sp. ESL0378]|uniref:DNA adenine methylase n=1 Tax=Bombella sp. ESL0378 TaxID=2676442 RepID=UPI0012D91191|nr:DNA adenine methylase [Bombella sp. ESL0378]MUG04410.1 Dam family site-specific DNA-(adenine-N6)-methyltransferase [Bombella sp. ESL0378]
MPLSRDKSNFIHPKPFVKWAGGKRQLVAILQEELPEAFNTYYEPFLGGGALFFSQLPQKAAISDINSHLINAYTIIRDELPCLLQALSKHQNTPDYFYAIRAQDPTTLSKVEQASRFIFLNKTCFNGLYRENKKGQFNTPFGKYKNPNILDATNLTAIHGYLNEKSISISRHDYKKVRSTAQKGDFVYLDPPYVPLTPTANFSSYTKQGFTLQDQEDLAALFKELSHKGVKAMLSNSNTEIVRELYRDFDIKTVSAKRAINCKGGSRGKEPNEVIVKNY